MANYLPAPYETNPYRSTSSSNNNNVMMDLSDNNQNYPEIVSSYDSAKPAIYLGDGWCTFPDLDNFDSEKLLKAFTLKEKDSSDSIWDPSITYSDSSHRTSLSISALRQLEALFNISQLLFGLSRAETVNYTFRDLQLRKHPHSFKKSGFKQLSFEGRTDFYAIFEQLVNVIIEEGGLEVTMLMYKNPMLPMVRQKCLDLISNVATVPDVAVKIMKHQSWFIDHLLILVRDGEIVSDKIPALSVLIRLLKVMLTGRMISAYMKLVDMQYIDCLVDIFENPVFTESAEFLPFFIKFEFITMQSLTVILGDSEYSQLWSDKAKTRLLNYCMIVFLKAAGAYPIKSGNRPDNHINHIFYAEQHTNKHSLAHTIMTVTELLRNDENMKIFYRYHRPFKQLIIQLYKKYGAKSQYIRTDPGISYALNHLMRVLYIKSSNQALNLVSSTASSTCQSVRSKKLVHSPKNLLSTDEKEPRVCSNPECSNEETKYKIFKTCKNCNGQAAYCSSKCKKVHIGTHLINDCRRDELIYNSKKPPYEGLEQTNDLYENVKHSSNNRKQTPQPQQHQHHLAGMQSNNSVPTKSYNRIYSSKSTSNYQKNATSRRASENLHQKNFQEHYQSQRRRESSGGRECNHQEISNAKQFSKFSSINENNRSSLNEVTPVINRNGFDQIDTVSTPRIQVQTVYARHTSSIKETKSNGMRRMSAVDEEASQNKMKFISSRENYQTNPLVINDTTASSFQFHRPLKTSTAVCLPDLSRPQSQQEEKIIENLSEDQTLYKQDNEKPKANTNVGPTIIQKNSDSSLSYTSNLSSSESTSISSSVNKNPQKKFKVSTGSKSIPKIEKMKKLRECEKRQQSGCEDAQLASIGKRRHSALSTTNMTSSSSSSLGSSNEKTTESIKSELPLPLHTLNLIEERLFYHGSEAIRFIDDLSSSVDSDQNESEPENEDLFSEEGDLSTENSSQSSFEQSNETGELKDNVDLRRLSDQEDEENEIENERWADNGQCVRKTSRRTNEINEDEHDRRSQFKVIKEFEKTMEFVKNASSLKVMPALAMEQLPAPPQPSECQDVFEKQLELEQPQITLASLCYDESECKKQITNQAKTETRSDQLASSEEDIDSDTDSSSSRGPQEFTKRPSIRGRNLMKGVNLIINNSIDSHMLKNSMYSMKSRNGAPTANSGTTLNRKNTDSNLKKHYKKNSISRCNSIGNSNNSHHLVGNKIVSDRKIIDDNDGYHDANEFNVNYQNKNDLINQDNNFKQKQFAEDDMSLFEKKNEALNTNRLSDYKSFKMPLMQTTGNDNFNSKRSGIASTPNLQYNMQPLNQKQKRRSALIGSEQSSHLKELTNNYQIPQNQQQKQQPQIFVQKHSELKVFSNINTNLTVNSLNQTEQSTVITNNEGSVKPEIPKNSTPISTDLGTQQNLSAKHRHFLNAQLDLTIVPPNKQQIQQNQLGFQSRTTKKIDSPQQKSIFLVPQVPGMYSQNAENKPQAQAVMAPISQIEMLKKSSSYKTSTLKSNSNLIVNMNEVNKKKTGGMHPDILDVSKISALENATSTNGCVMVQRTEIPRDLRKTLKDELKKDKKQCIIS